MGLVPPKLVVTLKPGPRRKVRLVACGNYIDKSQMNLHTQLQQTGLQRAMS